MTTTPTPDDTRVPTSDAVRTALIDLLTTGQHHNAATPTTLQAVAATRRTLTQHTGRNRPVARYALAEDHHTALSGALGDIAHALRTERPIPDYDQLHTGLSTLAAIALAWLDTLPTPIEHDEDDDYQNDDDGYEDPQPF